MSVGKVILYGLLATIGPIIAWFVLMVVVAAETSSWGASRAENAMIGLLVAEVVLFGGASVFFFRSLRAVTGGAKVAVFVVHLVVQIATMLMLAFASALMMNR